MHKRQHLISKIEVHIQSLKIRLYLKKCSILEYNILIIEETTIFLSYF